MCTVEAARSVFLLDVMRRISLTGFSEEISHNPRLTSLTKNVCRQLFDGDVDHAETARHLQRETKAVHEEVKNRWNFDFESELALRGRFEWSPVTSVTHSDRFPSVPSASLNSASSVKNKANLSLDINELLLPVQNKEKKLNKRSKHEQSKEKSNGKFVQRKLTEYMTQRKRPASSQLSRVTKSKIRRAAVMTSATPMT